MGFYRRTSDEYTSTIGVFCGKCQCILAYIRGGRRLMEGAVYQKRFFGTVGNGHRPFRRNLPHVILSEQSESKDLRTCHLHRRFRVRRSFDFGLRPSLRMTDFRTAAPSGGGAETDTPGGVALRASFSWRWKRGAALIVGRWACRRPSV